MEESKCTADPLIQFFARLVVAILRERLGEEFGECAFQPGQLDAVLWSLGPGDAGLHVAEFEFEFDAVVDLTLARDVEHVLRLEIVAERDDLFVGATRRAQVVQRFVVHGKEPHRRAVFGRHVGDRGAVGHGQGCRAFPEELDEFADNLRFAQHLRDVQGEVGRGHAFAKRAGHVDTDDFRGEEIDRLAEHAGFGFDAADAPTDDAESVDHRRVRIGPDQRVGVVDAVRGQHALGEVFQIDLVHDTDARAARL